MARTINYELKAQKIKGQIDELVTALLEERINSVTILFSATTILSAVFQPIK